MSMKSRLDKILEQVNQARPEPGMAISAVFCRKGTCQVFEGQGGPYVRREFETDIAFHERALRGARASSKWNEIPIVMGVK